MTEALKDTPKNTPEEKNEICEKAFKSIYPSCGCKNTELLESLKGILGNDVAERIKNFNNYNKPVLFIGSISSIRGALAYLWYTHDHVTPPLVIGCSGLNEDEAKTKLNDTWADGAFTNYEYFDYLGEILFLENLNPYENILNQLWDKADKYRDSVKTGILVVGMNNTGNLSQRLLGQFEVIRLEPEKQDIPASTPQDTPETKYITTFPIPSGAKVSDIKIVFLDDETVHITIKEKSKTFHYTQIGFYNTTTMKPLAEWNTLLVYAENNGAIPKKIGGKDIQKDSERINKKLQTFFMTKEKLLVKRNPLFHISKRKNKDDDKKRKHIQKKECPKCKDIHSNYCFICKDETEQCKECHNELYEETHAKLSR